MIPGRFAYLRPATARDAWQALADDPSGSLLLSGGTWVVPELHQGLRTARRVVDLRGAALGGVREAGDDEGDVVHLGTTTTYADLLGDPTATRRLRLLAAMAATVTGGAALHNQGTLGGSLCAARPTSDALGAVVTAGGTAHIEGPRGARSVPAAEFVVGRGRTVLEPDELLVGLSFRPHDRSGVGYRKIKRGTSSWPVVAASALVDRDAAGTVTAARCTVAGLVTVPTVVPTDGLVGRHPEDAGWSPAVDEAVNEAVAAACRDVEPYGDELASGAYRLAVAPVAARDALARALRGDPRAIRPEQAGATR